MIVSSVSACTFQHFADDNHSLKGVTADDLKAWVEEVYNTGKAQAQRMAAGGDKRVDPSLFGVDSDEPKEEDEKDVEPAAGV